MHVLIGVLIGLFLGGIVAHYSTKWGLMNEMQQIVTQFHQRLDAIEVALDIKKAHVADAVKKTS